MPFFAAKGACGIARLLSFERHPDRKSAFGAKHGQTLAPSGVIRHRNKGKNLRGAEQLEGPLPNGCSAPRGSDPYTFWSLQTYGGSG